MRRIKPPNIHPPQHFSHRWESVIESKRTAWYTVETHCFIKSKQTSWSAWENLIPSSVTTDIRLYMQSYRVNDRGSGLKPHLVKRGLLCMWAGLRAAHTKSSFLLSQYLVPFPGAPLWLSASLTITSVVLATKPTWPPLTYPPFHLLSPWTNKPDQVSQTNTQRLLLCRPPYRRRKGEAQGEFIAFKSSQITLGKCIFQQKCIF